MNNPTSTADSGQAPTREQIVSAMFAHLVMQQTNMAMIFLGLSPNPQTGQTVQDLDNARYFIDQLEMLEVKTKGNLDKQEQAVLKQSLTSLRMAFVEAVNHPQPPSAAPSPAPAEAAPEGPATDEQETPVNEPPLPGENPPPTESRKIFSKKYS